MGFGLYSVSSRFKTLFSTRSPRRSPAAARPLPPATNGCLFMMGMNLYGQLGINNTLTPYTTPQRTLLLSNVTSLALGIYHSVAIANSGKYYAWGLNRGFIPPRGDPLGV